MNITIDIKPEVQTELARQAAIQGRSIEAVAARLLEGAIQAPDRQPLGAPAEVAEACEQLKTFGKRHGLSLGGTTLRQLRDEARP